MPFSYFMPGYEIKFLVSNRTEHQKQYIKDDNQYI